MTKYKYIIETVEGAIGRLVLNRPERHNALNIEMIRELSESIQHLNKIATIRLIKIEAKGTNFSAGADLNWMKEGLNQSEDELLAESEELASLFNDIYNS
ncbi:MAG: enoyl-CoA hydratase/isomerase family protein, partial [Bacteroidales bacterium]|nr:enoyl-CoA hydratase/isomerase family protein [Bacteroidales bacterium]